MFVNTSKEMQFVSVLAIGALLTAAFVVSRLIMTSISFLTIQYKVHSAVSVKLVNSMYDTRIDTSFLKCQIPTMLIPQDL